MHGLRVQGVVSRAATRVHARALSGFNSQSIGQKLFDTSSMPSVPLDKPLPNVPAGETFPALEKAATISTLPNGLRVVSVDAPSQLSSVGVFVDAGSRYESQETAGMSHFFEQMAFTSTANRSDFRLIREMLKIGANVMTQSSREHVMLTADVLRQYVPHALGTFADVIQNRTFDQHEVQEQATAYAAGIKDRSTPDVLVMEGVQEAAYRGKTLGNPLYAPEHTVKTFTAEALEDYVRTFFTPSRMVVAGVGVAHNELVNLATSTFDALPADSGVGRAPAEYTGGEVRMHHKSDDPMAHLAIAFETASWTSQDLVPMCVLQIMMGGGGSFSAGGPGKGMCSRLYEGVLNQYHWVESASSFNYIHADSGLFGIYGMSSADSLGNLADVFSQQLIGMAGPVNAEELNRAQNQLKSSVCMQLETRALALEDIGRQVVTYGKVFSAQELCQQIDAVTSADIQRVASTMLSTTPSVSAHGDLANLPRFDELAKRFG